MGIIWGAWGTRGCSGVNEGAWRAHEHAKIQADEFYISTTVATVTAEELRRRVRCGWREHFKQLSYDHECCGPVAAVNMVRYTLVWRHSAAWLRLELSADVLSAETRMTILTA